MRKIKTKLASMLIALTCVFACLGVGVFVANNNGLEARAAANTYTITEFKVLPNQTNASNFYAYAVKEEEKPAVDSWTYEFTFVAESGEGVKLNGEAYEGWKVKQPGRDFFIELGREAAAGDVFTIGGTFFNADADAEIILPTTSFEWNGTAWVDYVAYTVHNIGALDLHVNSQPWGGAGSQHNAIYLQRADGEALAFYDWDNGFTAASAENFKINGVNAELVAFKSTDAGLYVQFDRELNAGEYITISCTFVCDAHLTKYVVEESSFMWTADGWKKHVVVNYETYTVTEIGSTAASNNSVAYFYSKAGDELPKAKGDWDNKYTLVEGEITLNGNPITLAEVKMPGDLYVVLGFDAQVGDVLAFNGALANSTKAIKIVFENCELKWDGSAWVANEVAPEPPVVEYTTYEIGALNLHNNSVIGGAKDDNKVVYLKRVDGETFPILNWEKPFVAENADNFKVNGVAHSLVKVVSTNDGFYWSFGEALNAGDYITISGTFACESELVKYVIEESSFVWTGTAWELYVDYTTHETTGLIFAQTGEGNKHVYFVDAEGHDFPVATTENDLNWTTPFSWKDGVGVTLNGNAVSATVKFPGQMFIDLGVAPSVDDILVVGGTFYSPALAFAYVIEETTFTWDGTTWVAEGTETPEYEVFTVTAIGPAGGSNETVLYAYATAGDDLPKERGDWDNAYTLVEGEVTLNGTPVTLAEVKLPGDLYIVLGFAAQAGDVLTLNGAFANETTLFKFVFEDCSIKWNGSNWETVTPVVPEPPVVEEEEEVIPVPDSYERYELGEVTSVSGNAEGVYLAFAGKTLPISSWDYAFNMITGEGITVDGKMVRLSNNIKSVGSQLYVALRNVEVGSILRISGIFGNADTELAYVIEESEFKWNGTAWETTKVVEYDVHEFAVELHANSKFTSVNAGHLNNQLYLARVGGDNRPINNWDDAFVAIAGGIKVNGEPVTLLSMKSAAEGLWIQFDALNPGDVITIEGTFVCEAKLVKYVIEASSFQWSGHSWAADMEYEEVELGAPVSVNGSTTGVFFYFDSALPVDSWDAMFNHIIGNGITVDGVLAELNANYKSAEGSFYANLSGVVEGSILKIGGKFCSPEAGYAYIIEETIYEWNGSAWVSEGVVEYSVYNVGKLDVAITVLAGSDMLYLAKADGSALPFVSADATFVASDVNNFKVNGVPAELYEVLSTEEGLFFLLDEVETGTIVTVSGVFVCESELVKYLIDEGSYVWTGIAWSNYIPAIEEFELGHGISATGNTEGIYVTFELGSLPLHHWTAAFTFEEGYGITIDGVQIDMENAIKSVSNTLYIGLKNVPIVGSVLKIGGIFSCVSENVVYVIEESEFTWDGAVWSTDYIPDLDLETYELGQLILHQNSVSADVRNNALYLKRFDGEELPVLDWEHYVFTAKTAGCLKVNGANVQLLEMKSTPDGLYVVFDGLNVGDTLTISGSFICSTLGIEYVIEESTFEWVGSWRQEVHIEYDTYEVGALVVWAPGSSETAVYLQRADGKPFQIDSWDFVFAFVVGSGSGLTLNGTPLATTDIKSPGGSMYIGLGVAAQIGDELTIAGTYGNLETATAYIISESTFVLTQSGWVNKIDTIKTECRDELDNYFATFDKDLYYESEWNYMQDVVKEAKNAIQGSYAQVEIREILADAKATLDSVMTKDVADANIESLRASSKSDLDNYKNSADYRPREWTIITTIIDMAKAEIDEATSVSAIIVATKEAKANIDAIKTDAMITAEEAVVQAAKDELAGYKSEADYRAKEWAEIQAILESASKELDDAVGFEEDIEDIVAKTKAKLDAVKVREVAEADDAVVNAAKDELATYKSKSAYYDAQWAEIQAIITEANSAIDAAIGDEAAIAEIVAAAKAEMDNVLVMDAYDEYVFNKAIEDSKNEIMNYYNALNYDLYSEEAMTTINGYVASAMDAIDSAATVEEMQSIVSEFKSNVDSVKQISTKPVESTPAPSAPAKSGCGLSIGGAVSCLIPMLAMAVVMISRKKRED